MSHAPCALIMAGGTGGHIFPALALADALHAKGWQVHWLGTPDGMEANLVAQAGYAMQPVHMGGVRGKGPWTLAWLPLRLLRAFAQSWRALGRVRPAVVVGFGGYVTFPGAMMAVLRGKPLLLHEQNAVAGLVNRLLRPIADGVYSAFPGVLPQAQWIGNPLRAGFIGQTQPAQRLAGRSGPLRVLVLGGSRGAKALNHTLPQALAAMDAAARPQVQHQTGRGSEAEVRALYAAAGVTAQVEAFIDDTAAAMQHADVVIARAGASTVTELAALGVAALLVPFPHAVDDHQTANARFLSEQDAAWLQPQAALTPQWLAQWLAGLQRADILRVAERAHALAQTQAVPHLAQACAEQAGVA